MKIFKTCPWLATLVLGLSCASAGFSFALVTSVEATAMGTGARAIGTSCTRRGTEFVTDSDLGLAVIGSQFTRQLLVRYGFGPQRYSFGAVTPSGGIALSSDGKITGVLENLSPEIFEVRVADNTGGQILPSISRFFAIRGIEGSSNPTPLQFLTPATLPTGVANAAYGHSISVTGGEEPYKFAIADSASAAALPKGLAVGTDGVLYGKPTAATLTPASFAIRVTDATGLTIQQTFTLTILPGTIRSEFVATGGSFNLNFGADGSTDSLKLTLVLNKDELSRADIRQPEDLLGISFAMRFGSITLPPAIIDASVGGTGLPIENRFDRQGRITFPTFLTPFGQRGTVTYSVSLNPSSGILTINMRGVDLIEGVGANFNSFVDPAVPVNIKLGTAAAPVVAGAVPVAERIDYDRTDLVKFLYRRRASKGKGTARANDRLAPAGLFLVTKVDGSVRVATQSADLVTLKLSGFLRNPGGTALVPTATDTVNMFIGQACIGAFPASSLSLNGDRLTFINTDESAIIRTLMVDNAKGTFVLETNPFTPRQVFEQDFLSAGVPYTFPLTLTLAGSAADPSFDGQTSVTIFRRGNKLKNK